MQIVFPCRTHHRGDRRASTALGSPVRAMPCRCHTPWVEDGGCCRCGRWLRWTIDTTWAVQAGRMAGGSWAGTAPRVAARRLELVA